MNSLLNLFKQSATYNLYRLLVKEVTDFFETLGEMGIRFLQVLKFIFKGDLHWKKIIDECSRFAWDSLPITLSIVGMSCIIISMQLSPEMVKQGGEKFIGTQRMGREIFEEGDRRYQYSVPYQSDGDMVTVIGIQEQGTLTYVKGATPNMLSGELDKKTALKKSGMSSGGVSIFRVVLTILLLSTGIRMLLKKISHLP